MIRIRMTALVCFGELAADRSKEADQHFGQQATDYSVAPQRIRSVIFGQQHFEQAFHPGCFFFLKNGMGRNLIIDLVKQLPPIGIVLGFEQDVDVEHAAVFSNAVDRFVTASINDINEFGKWMRV